MKKKKTNYSDPVIKPVIQHNLSSDQKEAFKAWVEEFTGGPNKCQVAVGGVCLRPDIILGDKCCNDCPYNEYCLCRSKVIR